MELPVLQRQSLNNSLLNYFKLPSENEKVQDLDFQLNKQRLDMINSLELTECVKIQQLKNIQEVAQSEVIKNSHILEKSKYNVNMSLFDYNKLLYNEEVVNIYTEKIISLPSSFAFSNSLISYNDEKRGGIVMNDENIKNMTDSYSENLLPSISFGMGIGIITAALKIAMDYIFAPLMMLVVVDIFLSGCADIFTKQKEGKIFRKIVQYFIIFFILTWLIVLELILLRYNLTPMIKPVLNNHLLVYSFLGGACFMCYKNIKNSMIRLELPVAFSTRIFQIALEKFSPDAMKFLEKYSKEIKEKDTDKTKKP